MLLLWLSLLVLAGLALLPVVVWLVRPTLTRGRRDAAIGLYREQLREVDRDLGDGLIGVEEHATARLEIERRLLSEAGRADAPAASARSWPLVAAISLVPVASVALYLVGGHPDFPAQPLAARMRQAASEPDRDAQLIAQLRASLATLDPRSERARDGWLLVAQAEATRGDWPGAADAFGRALAIKDDATVAFETAEARTRATGHVGAESLAQYRHALDEAPGHAPWRMMAEQRVAEGEHGH